MKNFSFSILIVAIVLTILLFSNNASTQELSHKQMINHCNNISELARTIMTKRQNGVTMREMMNVEFNEKVRELVHGLIIAAYDVAKFNSSEYKNKYINRFENEVYSMCIKEMKK